MKLSKSLFALAICFAVTMPLTACDNPEQKEARYIKKGNAQFDKGEYEKARIEYRNAARSQPTAAEPFYRMALVDEQEGDLRNAFIGFSAAEQQDKNFYPAILKTAQYYMAGEEYDQAQKRIDQVLGQQSDNAEAHAVLAALLLREKNLDEAEKQTGIALAKDPANISAFSALTGIYAARNDFDKAQTTIDDGIARNPQNLPLMMLRVLLDEQTNDLPKIANAYQSIFKLKPNESHFRVDLASIYTKAGQLDQAEATLRDGITALPDDWELKHQLIVFLGDYRGVDQAEKEAKDLISAYPKNDEPYFWLADLYVNHDATDRAVALLEEIVSHEPASRPSLDARTMLASIDIKRGNQELADQLVAAVLAKEPDNAAALFVRASTEYDKGYYQSAVSDLRSILRNTPGDHDALNLLGETLLAQGRLDLAIDTMKKLVELNPADFATQVRLAQVVHINGDNEEAMRLITVVTKASPDYAVGWETAARIAIDGKNWLGADQAVRTLDGLPGQHLTALFLEGEILANTGHPDDAIAKYTQVIDADPTAPLAEHALKVLTETYQKLGRMDAAASYLETLKADTPLISTLLGASYGMIGKKTESATALDKAIDASASFPEPYLDRAKLYIDDHKTDQAIDVLKKGALAAPRDFRDPMMEADLLGNIGKYQEAIALYDNILSHNADLDAAANNQAELIADYQFNDSTALEKARQTAERFANSPNPALLDTLAWVYFRQDNVPMAQTLMERVMANPDQVTPQIHYHYAAILIKAGKKDVAKSELEKATSGDATYIGSDDARKLLAGMK